jgi:fatty-acyl-CoA synthase
MGDVGHLLGAGERGEIVVRGPLVMAGYYKNSLASAEAGRYGWHHTGDIGYLDQDNVLFIVDRAKDMIITGGFNVYSAEVEQVLLAHPAVQDCAVIGLPDEKWGERVTAVVQLRPGQAVTEDEIRAFVKGPAGQRQGPQAGCPLAGPAPLQGRQGPQGRGQGPVPLVRTVRARAPAPVTSGCGRRAPH